MYVFLSIFFSLNTTKWSKIIKVLKKIIFLLEWLISYRLTYISRLYSIIADNKESEKIIKNMKFEIFFSISQSSRFLEKLSL